MKKTLKPGGQVIIIDFHKKETPVGPPMEMRVSREEVMKESQQNAFRLVKEHTFFPYQDFLIFTAESAGGK